MLVAAAVVLFEGLGTTPQVRVPAAPVALAQVEAPYLVLPSDGDDGMAMLWSTDRFAPLVNGNSGVLPAELARTRDAVVHFPDARSVAYLRTLGIRTVVVLGDRVPYDPATLSIENLDVTRTVVDGAVVFRLPP